jgi:hypothetical protein
MGIIKGAPLAYDDPRKDYDKCTTEERKAFFHLKGQGKRAPHIAFSHMRKVHHAYNAAPPMACQTIETIARADRPLYTQSQPAGAPNRIEFWRQLNGTPTPDQHVISEARLAGSGQKALHTCEEKTKDLEPTADTRPGRRTVKFNAHDLRAIEHGPNSGRALREAKDKVDQDRKDLKPD